MHHFIAVHLSGILQWYGQSHAITGLDALLVHLGLAVVKGCIAQSVSEGEQRFAFEVTVGAVAHVVVFKIGKVTVRSIESKRQASGRVIVAKQDIGHGCASLLTGIPCFEHCIQIFGFPGQCQRAARTYNEDNRFAGLLQSFQHFFLYAGQVDVSAVAFLETGKIHRHLLTFQCG